MTETVMPLTLVLNILNYETVEAGGVVHCLHLLRGPLAELARGWPPELAGQLVG